jgi:hypothetical protein
VDLHTIYNVCGVWILTAWMKFKPIIEDYRRWEWPKNTYENWEYLADALAQLQNDIDDDARA